ncbi:cytochrome P450 [Mycobacterium palustre]|nr:cytochrome P450 [Mycobacterium palustre]
MMHGFQPIDPLTPIDDLATGWARARTEAPVFFVPEHNTWCVSSYALIEEVLRSPETFSSAAMGGVPVAVPERFRDDLPDGRWPVELSLTSMDPPEHTRIRKLVQPAFTARMANAAEGDVGRIANEVIDAFIDNGKADIATEYSHKIPIKVIAPMLGVPPADVDMLYGWAMQALFLANNESIPADLVDSVAEGQCEYVRYARKLIEDRRANPRGENDLLTHLIFATADDEPVLSQTEVLGMVLGILIAGMETTATAMGNAIHLLLSQGLWQKVVDDPDLAARAAEEGLRLRPPLTGIHRVTTRDCELGGVLIPAGSLVHLSVLSANRDEAEFTDSEKYISDRANARTHMTFGKFTHNCLGAPFARVELRVGIHTLAQRIPSLRLSEDCDLQYMPSTFVRALLGGLRAEWDT